MVAFMLRSYDASGGAVYYCSGDVMAATPDHMISWGLWDEGCLEYEDENGVYYNMVVVNLTEQWQDRINLIRFDFFDLDPEDEEDATFDFCWAGTFRSVEEAQAYTQAWATENKLETIEEETEEPTEAPTEEPTEVPGDAETQNGDAETDAPAATDPATDPDEGCASVVTASAAVVLTAVAAAFVLKKKD